jgi:hypothetical protein
LQLALSICYWFGDIQQAMSGLDALVAGDQAAFEQLCAMLMSSQNEQRAQVRLDALHSTCVHIRMLPAAGFQLLEPPPAAVAS